MLMMTFGILVMVGLTTLVFFINPYIGVMLLVALRVEMFILDNYVYPNDQLFFIWVDKDYRMMSQGENNPNVSSAVL